MRLLLLLASFALLCAPAAWAAPTTTITAGSVTAGSVSVTMDTAGKRISIDFVEVDGLRIEALSCAGTQIPFLGALVLGPAVAQGAKAAQACQATGGGAAKVRWTWAGGATAASEVLGVDGGAATACLQTALTTMPGAIEGQCEAILLLGERTTASAAAARLGGAQP
jgi:hypothetical protein